MKGWAVRGIVCLGLGLVIFPLVCLAEPVAGTTEEAANRVCIQLTPLAAVDANKALAASRSPSSRTGISSLDGVTSAMGLNRARRIFDVSAGKSAKDRYGLDRFLVLEFSGPVTDADLASIKRDPAVADAWRDHRATPATVPTDSLYAANWGHHNTGQFVTDAGDTVGTPGFDAGAPVAWDQGYGDPAVVVALLDTGVDTGHPDLRLTSGYDFGDDDQDPMDDCGTSSMGHGTATAGIIGAMANGVGAVGAAPGCTIMPIKVIRTGAISDDMSAVAAGIQYAADQGADIACLNLGVLSGASDPATDAALQYAHDAGLVLISATHNQDNNWISYPANNAHVIAVGAASPCGERKSPASCDGESWWGSNYGWNIQDDPGAVDLLGPTILPTTDITGPAGYDAGDYTGRFNGTSCATPYATGVAALVLSQNPGFTPDMVRSRLCVTATDVVSSESGVGWDRYSGYGLVNAAGAVDPALPSFPTAHFAVDQTYGCKPFVVSFMDQSSGVIDSWLWDFGDGATSTEQNPTHAYSYRGIYHPTLTVANAGGSASWTLPDSIDVGSTPTPYWYFSTSNEGTAPLTVGVHNGSSPDPFTSSWDFGDGSPADTTFEPTHTYTQPGTYQVVLTVSNERCGSAASHAKTVTVSAPPPPGASFTADVTSGCAPLAVAFTDSMGTDAVAWWWEFGDGSPADSTRSPTHIYAAGGVYSVSLTVRDAYGQTTTFTRADYLAVDQAPAAGFAAAPTSGDFPLAVAFTDSSAGTVVSRRWDFGDGSPVDTTVAPIHVYTQAGAYSVRLVVSGACGTDTLLVPGLVNVSTPAPPVAAFGASPAFGCAPLTVAFSDSSTGAVTSWLWDFGDGSPADTTRNPMHTYLTEGSFTVILTVTGPGGSDTLTVPDMIGTTGLHADFTGFVLPEDPRQQPYTPPIGCAPLMVGFADSTAGPVMGWLWDFGDGSPADTTQNPLHIYGQPGLYDVTLIATGPCDADTLTRAQYVNVVPPTPIHADFSATPTVGPGPLAVAFHDSSTGFEGMYHLWDFGDGSPPDTTANPVHIYDGEPGSYTVTLVVFAPCSTDTLTRVDYITIMDPSGVGDTPARFALDRAYPNPFNPTTTLSFALPTGRHATLEIYDVSGRRVATLVDADFPAGRHKVVWQAGAEASGVYFARLRAGRDQAVARLVLLK